MLRFKILRAILIFLLALTVAAIIYFSLGGEEDEVSRTGSSELKDSDRTLIMKEPVVEWSGNRLSAEEMEILKNKENPNREKHIYKNFTLIKKNSGADLKVTGAEAALDVLGQVESNTAIIMSGGVKCEFSNGWYIASSLFNYSRDGILQSENPVTFGSKNSSGGADTFSYNGSTGKVHLSGNINLEIETSDTPGDRQKTTITTSAIEYDANTGAFFMTGGFNAKRNEEYLRGGRVEGKIEPASRKLINFDVIEKAELCLKNLAAAPEDTQTLPEENKHPFNLTGFKVISSPVIKFFFRGDEYNHIKSIETVRPSSMFIYRKELSEKPEVRFIAPAFLFTFREDDGKPEKMQAGPDVKITQILTGSQGIYKRIINCDGFDGSFSPDGTFAAINLSNRLSIEEPSYTIRAKGGAYDNITSMLTFQGYPVLIHKDGISAGEQVQFNLKDSTLLLKKNVVSKFIRSEKKSKVFSEGDEVFINAGELTHNTDSNTSIYKENVKIYQEKNYIFSDYLEVQNEKNSMIAKTQVRGKIYESRDKEKAGHIQDAGSDKKDTSSNKAGTLDKKKTLNKESEFLEFKCQKATIDEDKDLIILEKNAEAVRSNSEEIKGDKIEYRFKESINDPLSAEATGSVFFKKEPYEGKAEKLFYDYEKDLITLKGPNVVLYSGGKPLVNALELTFTGAGDIIDVKSLPGQRIEAVWKPEQESKGDQKGKKKK